MGWLMASQLAALSGSAILTFVFLHLMLSDRRAYMRVWALAWALHTLHFVADLASTTAEHTHVNVSCVVSQVFSLTSGVLLLAGTYMFLGRRVPGVWYALAGFSLAAVVIGHVLLVPFWLEIAPASVLLGVANIATGVAWARARMPWRWGGVTGTVFVLWGVLKFAYPLTRPIESLAPAGYLTGAALSYLVAMLALVSYFEVAKQRLTESEERYRSLFTGSGSVMLLVDPESGAIVDANPAAADYYGWDRETLREMRIQQINTLPADGVRQEMRRAVGGEENHFTFRHRRADGSVADVEVYSGPVQVAGRTMLLSIVHDISRRVAAEAELAGIRANLESLVEERTEELARANEELERATRMKDDFLARVSHELRTPLNSIIGFSDVLLRGMAGELSDEQHRQIALISRAGHHLLELVNDLLDLERLVAGKMDVDLEEVDVRGLVGDLHAVFERMAAEKGIEFDTDIEGEVRLVTDRRHLEQILWNLLGNAVKYTERGGVAMRVRARDDRATFEVSDTGIGIEPSRLGSIFDEFVRATGDRSTRGTGLGLAISRRLAELLGGRISVDSELGKGSIFRLELPLGPQGSVSSVAGASGSASGH